MVVRVRNMVRVSSGLLLSVFNVQAVGWTGI